MTLDDIYIVLEDDQQIIIGENSPYGLITKHVGSLRDCSFELMNSSVSSIRGWEHGLIIEINSSTSNIKKER